VIPPADKILTLEALVTRREAARTAGRTFVFTNGCFDLLHLGHLQCFLRAREEGDILAVGVNTDRSVRENKGERRPLQPEQSRAMLVASLEPVSYVVLFDQPTPDRIIRVLLPDVLVKGAEYERQDIVGAAVVEAAGGRVIRVPMVEGSSTRSLISTIVSRYSRE
jgi:D-beta-D-heptose 7-phosphate kinase/D-beta-D-heptose 1-phosphate adenosyltransferase